MAKSKKIAVEKNILAVTARDVFGKKLKKLRHQGVIPGNIYGPDFKSTAVSLAYKDFVNTYKVAKETGIVYLSLTGKEIPVMVKSIQKHPVTSLLLHVDFRKVDLKQKITTEVPVVTVGESIAITQLAGVLLTQSSHLMVEAFPQDMPQNIQVDISKIKELGKEIKVSDLSASTKYTIKEEPNKVVVSIIEHKEESIEPETTTVAPEVITEKAPAEGEAAPAEAGGKETKETKETKQPAAKQSAAPAEKKGEK